MVAHSTAGNDGPAGLPVGTCKTLEEDVIPPAEAIGSRAITRWPVESRFLRDTTDAGIIQIPSDDREPIRGSVGDNRAQLLAPP